MRTVASLFVSKDGEVLLMSQDGGNLWKFPEGVMINDESTWAALQRVFGKKLDIEIEDEEVYNEGLQELPSSKGELTVYHICTTNSDNVKNAVFPTNGCKFIWTDKPFSYSLNLCTQITLRQYGYL